MSTAAEFRAALAAVGMDYPGELVPDGHLHRVKVNGDHNPNSWYVLHGDGLAAGSFGCWKRGIQKTWCAKDDETLTEAERTERNRKWKQQQAERDADRRRQHDEARAQAQAILDHAQPATNDHPYLTRKGVKVHPGVMAGPWPQRQRENCLLIPLRNVAGQLATVQAIFPDKSGDERDKDFLKGGSTKGAFFTFGDLATAPVVVIAEGYATAATLHEATGHAAVMAVDAGNLRPVVDAIRAAFPTKRILIAADNDRHTDGNPGLSKAAAAAKAIKVRLAIPEFTDGESGTDFNDLAAIHGTERVRTAIEAALSGPWKAGKANTPAERQEATPFIPLLKTNDGLAKHSLAAELLFEHEFNRRIVFDVVTQEWRFYSEQTGVFVKKSPMLIEQAIYQAIKKHSGAYDFASSYLSGVLKCLIYEAATELTPKPGKICFRNCVLDLHTREVEPHAPEHAFTTALPFDWNPNASEPTAFLTWLREAVGGHEDRVELLRAWLNAVIVGRPDLQRFLEIIGPGGSGKGTLLRLLSALVGNDAVHATALKQLEENRFESAKLYGKKLVIIGDAEKWHGDVSMLKAITGQDAIRFEQKHQQAGENFTYGGMVVIAANQHTKSTDYTSGIQRRRITIPFEHVVPPEQRRDLEAEFEPLLPSIIKWALDLPQEQVTALLRSTSTHVESLREARLEVLAATNPVIAWLLDNAYFDERASTKVGVKQRLSISEGHNDGDGTTETHIEYAHQGEWLYPNYVQWCDENGRLPVSLNDFSLAVVDVAKNTLGKPFVAKKRIRGGVFIAGVGLLECRPVKTCEDLVNTQPIEIFDGEDLREKYAKEVQPTPTPTPAHPRAQACGEKNSGEITAKVNEGPSGLHRQSNHELRSSSGLHSAFTRSTSKPFIATATEPSPAADGVISHLGDGAHEPRRSTDATPKPTSPLSSRIRQAVTAAGPGGIAQADLIREVANGRGASPPLIELAIRDMLLSGVLGTINDRLVEMAK